MLLARTMAEFRSTGFENFDCNTSWTLDFEVLSWRRVCRTFCVENLMGE